MRRKIRKKKGLNEGRKQVGKNKSGHKERKKETTKEERTKDSREEVKKPSSNPSISIRHSASRGTFYLLIHIYILLKDI